jgi:phosphonate transport system substrate-binding protein
MRPVKLLIVLLMASLLTTMAHAQCEQKSLRFAVIPKVNKPLEILLREYQPLLQRLGTALEMPVEIVHASSYESVIDAIVSGGVDIAWLGPASYILAHQRDPRIEPFASLTISPGYFTPAGHHYQSLLLTRRGVATDLNALRGTQLALTDPASTSGSVVPNAEFSARVGMALPQFFSSVVYSGSHDKSLDALLDRRVDAAFVSSVRVDAYLNSGKIKRDTFTVQWHSEPIYYDPFVFSGTLCPALKERIRAAMLNGQSDLSSFLDAQEASGIVPANHAEYEPLLRMMQQNTPAL